MFLTDQKKVNYNKKMKRQQDLSHRETRKRQADKMSPVQAKVSKKDGHIQRKLLPLQPDLHVRDFACLQPRHLRQQGIALLLCDVDNTLADMNSTQASRKVHDFLQSMKQAGIQTAIVSNNTKKHVHTVLAGLEDETIFSFSCKPLPFVFYRIRKQYHLPADRIAILGDQAFTDLLGGRLAGVYTILSDPLSRQERTDTKGMRLLEKAAERMGLFQRGKYYE